MEEEKKNQGITGRKKIAQSCESCEFYDYDEEWGEYVCSMSLDEDEMIDFLGGNTKGCPYYRYYDEYKSVHKQIWFWRIIAWKLCQTCSEEIFITH